MENAKKNWNAPRIEEINLKNTSNDPYLGTKPDGAWVDDHVTGKEWPALES